MVSVSAVGSEVESLLCSFVWSRVSHTEAFGSDAVQERRGLIEDCRMEFDFMLIDSTRIHLIDETSHFI